MNFEIAVHLISGMSVGVEYVPGDEEHMPSIVLDLVILRFIFSYERVEDVDS